MKGIPQTIKEIIVLFKTLRFFYDKRPDKAEVIDYKQVFEGPEKFKQYQTMGISCYYVADLQKLKLVEVGGHVQALVGADPQKIRGRNFAVALKFFNLAEIPDIMRAMIKYHQYVYDKPLHERLRVKNYMILKVKKKGAGYFTGLIQAVPLALDSQGHISHMYTSITDISRFQVDQNVIKGDIIDESNPEEVKVINIINKNFSSIDLSNAELRVLKLMAEGKSTKEISDILCLSEHTVNNHRKNMMHKTNAKNTAELISKTITLHQSFDAN